MYTIVADHDLSYRELKNLQQLFTKVLDETSDPKERSLLEKLLQNIKVVSEQKYLDDLR